MLQRAVLLFLVPMVSKGLVATCLTACTEMMTAVQHAL